MNWESVICNKSLITVLVEQLRFPSPTPVQAKCIVEFRNNRDVIVEAPTGSGKTLAYVIPVLEILNKKSTNLSKHKIAALILVPNRELAIQISDVVKNFVDETQFTLITFTGGKKANSDAERFQQEGGNIVVSTPGRFNDLLENDNVFKDGFDFRNCLKTLEILILDEADRLFEATFQDNMTSILEHLPKQKRVGLFSATQSTYEDELKKASLRNPSKITIKAEENGNTSRTPTTLKNYFTTTETFSKFATLCRFIKSHRKCKILLFVSTCACADYFGRLFKNLILPKKPKRFKNKRQKEKLARDTMQILTLHGKKAAKKRLSTFNRFRSAEKSCLLVCTDVMARGIDMSNIDWVLQYDLPRTVNFFLHRSGRTARRGQPGNSLLFLLPSETDYLDFLKRNQQVHVEELPVDCDTQYAENVFQTVRKLASEDRSLLIKGTRAFVSYILSYERHDCNVICHVKDLDIVNLAHSFGLLRLPRMPELYGRDLSGFRRSEVKTWLIPYANKTLEQQRQETIKEKSKAKEDASQLKENKKCVAKAEGNLTSETKKSKRAKREAASADLNEIQNDYKLLKKFKRGKMTSKELDDELTH